MRRKRFRWALLFFVSTSFCARIFGQGSPLPQTARQGEAAAALRIHTREASGVGAGSVVLHVVATDGAGEPFCGLEAHDFRLEDIFEPDPGRGDCALFGRSEGSDRRGAEGYQRVGRAFKSDTRSDVGAFVDAVEPGGRSLLRELLEGCEHGEADQPERPSAAGACVPEW